MPYTVKTLDELMNGPMEIDWVVDGIMAPRTSGMIAGAPGIGKTWFTLDFGLSSALRETGVDKKWLGFFNVKPGRVLIIDEESADLLLRIRMYDLCRALGINWKGLPIWTMTSQHVNLSPSKLVNGEATEPKKMKDLYKIIEQVKPNVIIWDSYARIHRSNENSADEMAAVLEQFKRICDTFDVCNVINHHLTKAPGFKQSNIRGSGDIPAFQDWAFTISGGGKGKLRVEHVKSRWGKVIPTFAVSIDETYGIKLVHESASEELTTDELVFNLCKDGKERQDLLDECVTRGRSESTVDRAIIRLIRSGRLEKSREGKVVMYYSIDDSVVPMPFYNENLKLVVGVGLVPKD